MADEEAVAVSLQASLDHPHKRKLDDLEPPSSDTLTDVAPPDSSLTVDGNGKGGDGESDVENGNDEPSKRPRLDESSDALASENGHKGEEADEQTVETADTAVAVENLETAVNDEAGGDEKLNEAPAGEANEVQPALDSEQKVDGEGDNSEGKDVEVPSSENNQLENEEKPAGDEVHVPATEGTEQGDVASVEHDNESGSRTRKIEIPNNKVGVLIGKAGDTIKYLQINSGAKIQITRDADADPRAPTRPVELVGTVESLNKAERLIKEVIAEADAGGSPSLVARGFTATMTSGSAEIEMPVPSDKVGLIIGRGGETIRNLQTRSGARIQLIPQSSPGDQSKEKKVKVTGDKKQVEMAKELIKEVMNQLPGRPTQFSGNNYNQQGYRPRGPGGAPQWGNRGPAAQPMPYDYHHRGPYPSQNQPYPGQSYGNYPPQGPQRGGFGSGWEHRPPTQGAPPHSGGYDYYGHGGGHAANAQVSAPQSAHMPGHASGPSMGPPPYPQPNYNHGQPRGADYAQPTPYPQTAPPSQTYGHGYGEPKYDSQGQVQQPYGGPGYPPQQQGYAPQQQYNRPPAPYGVQAQGAPPQGYAPPAASQPADAAYQAPVSAAQPYGQNVQPQQQYAYAAGVATQAPYGSAPAPVTNESYTQPQPQPAQAGYPQPGGQQYGQQAASYAQAAAPAAGYGQYPTAAQPGYTDQSAAATSAATYGYQGQVDPSAYAAGQAYTAAPAVAQQGYAQPAPAAQPGYDQSTPQSGGYATAPAGAPVAYGKTVSPQPGYPQYDASQQQMYAAPR